MNNTQFIRITQLCKDARNALSEAQDYRVLEALDKLESLLSSDKDFEEQIIHVKRQLYQTKLPNVQTDEITKNRCANAILSLCNLIEKKYKEDEDQGERQSHAKISAATSSRNSLFKWLVSSPSNYLVLSLFFTAHIVSHIFMEGVDFGLFIAILNITFSIYCITKTNGYVKYFSKDSYVTNEEMNYAKYLQIQLPVVADNPKDNWSLFKYQTNIVLSQVVFYWKTLWVAWICFYIIHIIGLSHKYGRFITFSTTFNNKMETVYDSFLFFFQNLGNICFVMLFFVMFESTTGLRKSENKNNKNNLISKVIDSERRQYDEKLLFGLLILMSVVFLWAYNEFNTIADYLTTFIITTGVFGGIAMCLFIGRVLDNKFVIIPWGIISALYFYALIRAFYPFIMTDRFHLGTDVVEFIMLWLIEIAFVLKILLFATISWLIDTQRLLYLIVEECSLHYKKEKDFDNFVRFVTIDSKNK